MLSLLVGTSGCAASLLAAFTAGAAGGWADTVRHELYLLTLIDCSRALGGNSEPLGKSRAAVAQRGLRWPASGPCAGAAALVEHAAGHY